MGGRARAAEQNAKECLPDGYIQPKIFLVGNIKWQKDRESGRYWALMRMINSIFDTRKERKL